MSKIFNKKKREARKMKRLEAKGRDNLTPEQRQALDDFHSTGSTDHSDYDMGDYEKSYK